MNRTLPTPLISGWLAFWIVLWFARQSLWFARALDFSRSHPWMPWIDALPAAIITGTLVGVLVAAVVALASKATARASMNLERGLRRIVLLVSLVIGAASFSAVGLEVSAAAHYQAAKRAYERYDASFQAWLAQHPVSETEVAARVRALRQSRRGGHIMPYGPDQDEAVAELSAIMDRGDMRPEHARHSGLAIVDEPALRRPWWTWPLRWAVPLGLGLALGLTALPWGVFYLVRWIVRGFLA